MWVGAGAGAIMRRPDAVSGALLAIAVAPGGAAKRKRSRALAATQLRRTTAVEDR